MLQRSYVYNCGDGKAEALKKLIITQNPAMFLQNYTDK